MLYVGAKVDPRRDIVSWTRLDTDGWINRLEFNVFRFEEIDTIRISILYLGKDDQIHRAWASLDKHSPHYNQFEQLHFYAYKSERRGTEMISVGSRNCQGFTTDLFVRGDHVDKLSGWEEKFVFWVPT